MTAADRRPAWMVTADEAILEDLRDQRLDYVPLVASRTGMHVPFVERRCRELAARGFLERATTEVTYRITDRGERFLVGSVEERSTEDPAKRSLEVDTDTPPRA